MNGLFISFEGIEGTGKSTQVGLLAEHLTNRGFKAVKTAEPGGTEISLKIRELLLSLDSRGMDPVTELLMYNAARVQHIKEVIGPAVARGAIVISDRFSDSTVAYQGYGRGLNLTLLDSLDKIATNRLRPDLTILLDLDVETGLHRNRAINKCDRLELEDVTFHRKVRQGFIKIAEKEPGRVKLIDCSDPLDTVHRKIIDIIAPLLAARKP